MYNIQEKIIKKETHPVWRGIGCILFILILVISYLGAGLLIQENNREGWLEIPASLAKPLSIPSVTIPYLGTIPPIYISNFFLNLPITATLSLLLFSMLSIIYYIIYKAGGGGRLDPRDVPPIRRHGGKRRKLRQD